MKSTQIVLTDNMIDVLAERLQDLKKDNQKVIQLKGEQNQVVLMHEKFKPKEK